MSDWDVAAVGRWLETSGFADFAPRFIAEEIDGQALLSLTAEDMKLLKMPLGSAKKILENISELKSRQRLSQPRATWSAGDALRLPTLTSTSDASTKSQCEVILLMGPPASGKSTLGHKMAATLGAEHFDLGEELRGSTDKQPETLLLNFLMAQMVKGKKKAEQGLGNHMVLINGYPRMTDGFAFWEELDQVVKASLVLVLEAPDDVLRARSKERRRESDGKFEERLKFYRQRTEPVITAFHDTGRTRFLDATPSMAFVEAAALYHLQASVVFACGNSQQICEEVVQLGLPYMVSHLDVNGKTGDSHKLVAEILSTVLTKPGQVVLLTGFPRNEADLQAWKLVDVLLVLDFESKIDFSGYLTRHFSATDREARNTVCKLLRSCQPIHVAAPFVAAALVRNWIDAARYCAWWDQNQFESFQGMYQGYLKAQIEKYSVSMFMRPLHSPPLEVWMVWLCHMLHGEKYAIHCHEALRRNVSPLPAPLSSSLIRHFYLERGKFTNYTTKLDLDSDALVSAPMAFVDGLASLQDAGLAPLSDPRALFFGVSHGSVANDLMKLLGLYYQRFLIVMGEAGEDSKAGRWQVTACKQCHSCYRL